MGFLTEELVDKLYRGIESKNKEIERLKKGNKLLFEWSERMTRAAADMLNRGQGEEKIKLRRLIDEWLHDCDEKHYEPEKEE